MRCLSKEPQLRPQGAGDLVAVLESVASGGLSSPSVNVPGEPTMLRKVLAVYAASFVGVAILARTAIVAIGLPDWVFPGALVVMALGLPVILVTAYAHYAIRRAATRTPTFTPGGTPSKAHGPIATLAVRAGSHLSWRRAFIGGVYAFAAFTTFIVGFMGLRTLGIGPAGSLLGKGELKARDRLLVTDFHVSAADSNYGPVVGELVAMRLSESPSVSVMSRMMLVDALARMSRSPRSTIDLDLARELASREGVKAIVDGTIVRIGTSLAVTMRLVTPDSGRELFSDQAVATSEEKLIPVVDHLSRELRRKIGESLKSVRASPPLEQVATPSLAALRLYTTASRLHFGGEGVRAIPLLRQAVAIDTEFATAYRMMGSAMRNAGLSRASSDSALAAAFRFRARLTEAERYRMLTTYYGNGPGRNRAEAIRAHETLLEMGDSLFLNSFGVFLTTRQEFARAETLYRAAIAKGFSGVLPYNNLGIALVNQGKWSEARTAAAAAIAKAPTAPGPVRFPILLLYHGGYQTGRLESYRHALDRLRSSESTPNRIWAIDRLSDLAVQQGALATAEKLYTEARSLDSSSGQTAPELSHVLRRVYIERIRGRRERAVERLDAELRKRPLEIRPEADRPYLAIANAYADLGDALRARAMLAQYQRQVTDTARKREDAPQTQYTLGLIALAEGRGAEASLHFKRSSQQPDGPATFCTACGFREIGEAFVVAGQTDSAIAMFERYLRTPWSERMTLLFDPISLAKVHRELAELYSLHADPESKRKAIEHNRLFIELWKDADVDLQSEVRNARIRLAELEPKVDARPPRILRGAGSSKQR
jgi:tetratricopeptide (TPR) repeat protein